MVRSSVPTCSNPHPVPEILRCLYHCHSGKLLKFKLLLWILVIERLGVVTVSVIVLYYPSSLYLTLANKICSEVKHPVYTDFDQFSKPSSVSHPTFSYFFSCLLSVCSHIFALLYLLPSLFHFLFPALLLLCFISCV